MQGRRQKNFQGWGNEKKEKTENKTENTTIKLLPWEGTEKKTENGTIKPLSTISVPCIKIQGGTPTFELLNIKS